MNYNKNKNNKEVIYWLTYIPHLFLNQELEEKGK